MVLPPAQDNQQHKHDHDRRRDGWPLDGFENFVHVEFLSEFQGLDQFCELSSLQHEHGGQDQQQEPVDCLRRNLRDPDHQQHNDN